LPALPTATVSLGQCQYQGADTFVFTPTHGLDVSQNIAFGNLAFPSVQISNQQTSPMSVPPLSPADSFTPRTQLAVNPNLYEGDGGYVLLICNTSSQAHVVSGEQVSIERIKLFIGELSAWIPCGPPGGCGGGNAQDEYMHADFAPNAPVGASVTATLTNSFPSGPRPLPVTLQPGQSLTIDVGVTPPTASGYYTFGFALTVDGASTGVVAYSPETLLAPVTHPWGQCASAQQTQIAETPTPTVGRNFFICSEP